MAGSVCNLEQRIFESLVSYTPGFAMPCLTGCSVGFMSLFTCAISKHTWSSELQEALICSSVNELYIDP